MVFSSPIFLFVFLPAVLCGYYFLSTRGRNLLLLAASLIFYAWGEAFYVLIMVVSIGVNYVIARLLDGVSETARKRAILGAGIALNLGLLGYFKYVNFVVENLNRLSAALGLEAFDWTPVHLPLGISFFTFQALSYLIDVYRGTNRAERSLVHVGLYISLFPQLIAGPIVRFHDVALQIHARIVTLKLAESGAQRFVYGLAKKVLVANPMGQVADQIFAIDGGDLTTPLAWLGLICYTLQIYFDFSGYSDMAIGLGRMLGFRFLENFDYPYVSRSIREFWRRWHISLSSWFRDYLYIPLGGNRRGLLRTGANLLIVFCLCGLWHGASWTFLLWGLYHGVFLVAERTAFRGVLERLPRALRHAYVLLVVMAGWVLFRCETLAAAGSYFAALGGAAGGSGEIHYLARYLDAKVVAIVAAGAVLATPLGARLNRLALERIRGLQGRLQGAAAGAYAGLNLLVLSSLMTLSVMAIAAGAYSPFIYFRF